MLVSVHSVLSILSLVQPSSRVFALTVVSLCNELNRAADERINAAHTNQLTTEHAGVESLRFRAGSAESRMRALVDDCCQLVTIAIVSVLTVLIRRC